MIGQKCFQPNSNIKTKNYKLLTDPHKPITILLQMFSIHSLVPLAFCSQDPLTTTTRLNNPHTLCLHWYRFSIQNCYFVEWTPVWMLSYNLNIFTHNLHSLLSSLTFISNTSFSNPLP